MSKISMVMEAVWLVLGAFCLVLGGYSTVQVGFSKSYMFFILAVVAVLMYLLRRHKRRIFSSNQNS